MSLPDSHRDREYRKFEENASDGGTDVRVALKSGSLTVSSSDEAFAYDTTTTADTIYLGYAAIGSATSAAVWKVTRFNTSTGRQEWADSDASYDNIWDNRASLTYG